MSDELKTGTLEFTCETGSARLRLTGITQSAVQQSAGRHEHLVLTNI